MCGGGRCAGKGTRVKFEFSNLNVPESVNYLHKFNEQLRLQSIGSVYRN